MKRDKSRCFKVQLFLESDISARKAEGWVLLGKIFNGPGGWRQAWMRKDINAETLKCQAG